MNNFIEKGEFFNDYNKIMKSERYHPERIQQININGEYCNKKPKNNKENTIESSGL